MRLIDRDKFLGDMFDLYIENRWSPRDIHFSLLDVRSNIDSPEYEVKAIPIEWIKDWRKHKWLSNKPIEERTVMAMGVRLMLEDWEKENQSLE